MIITRIQQERALEVLKTDSVEQQVKDTLKIIYCIVPINDKPEVEKLYKKLFEAGKKNDSLYKKICRMFAR